MTWAAILKSLLELFNGLLAFLSAKDNQDYGRLKERERNDKDNYDLQSRIDNADGGEVSDDEIIR